MNKKQRMLEIKSEIDEILETISNETRDLSSDEVGRLELLNSEFEALEMSIDIQDRFGDPAAPTGRITGPNRPDDGRVKVGYGQGARTQPNGAPTGGNGFRDLGEMALAIHQSGLQGGNFDKRLIQNAPSTYSTEGTGADGGFAVPPAFQTEIVQKVMGEESLLSRADVIETTSNNFSFPKDETTPWQSSGGVQAYWEGEAGQLTQSKIALEGETLKLSKITALIPVTEDLLEDAPALDSYLRRKVPEKFDWKISDAMVNGTGAGQPMGILNAGCLVSVAKESAQAADSILAENVINMWARVYGPCRKNAIWLINQDIEPQLTTMTIDGGNSSFQMYVPAGGLNDDPYNRLLGRPVVPCQACQTLGDKGDIVIADWLQYAAIVKAQQRIRADISMHLWFDYDMLAFRFIMRMAGQPWWRTAIDPANGTNTLSCFVTLDERAS